MNLLTRAQRISSQSLVALGGRCSHATRRVVLNVSNQIPPPLTVATTANTARRQNSHWTGYDMAPPDPIIGLNDAYLKDSDPRKVIVGVGAYRDDLGNLTSYPVSAKPSSG
jgi:hypothetical protein